MNHLWKNKLALFIPFGILAVGFSVFAASTPCPPTGDKYCNPLGSTVDIVDLTKIILAYLLKITLPLAVLAIIVSALYYIFASVSGNSGKTTEAKKTLLHILVGSVFVVGANALALAVVNFLKTLP